MRGVRQNGKGWQVSFGTNINEYYSTESEAIERRIELETTYGEPLIGGRKDHSEEVIGNYKVIGDTGTSNFGSQNVLVRNNITGEVSVKNIKVLKKFNQGLGGLGKKMINNTGETGVFKRKNKYVAHIGIEREIFLLGTFETKEEARKAYLSAQTKWLRLKVKPSKRVRRRKKDTDLPAGITRTSSSTFAVSLISSGTPVLRKVFKTLPEAEQALKQAKQQLKETN